MSKKVRRLAGNIARILCAVGVLSAALAWASVGGSISGTVKDPAGRVVPNAERDHQGIEHGALLPDA